MGLRQVNLGGVIVGTALYEQRFTVGEGQLLLDARKDET
jgi:phosphoribosylformimino-5-aminoimidazole carboxamide ribonucleotide (ProFAR) isomerase